MNVEITDNWNLLTIEWENLDLDLIIEIETDWNLINESEWNFTGD